MNHLVDGIELDDLSPKSPYFDEDKYETINGLGMIDCPACLGNGQRFNGQENVTCTICKGSGKVDEDFELTEEYLLDLEEEDDEFY